MAGCSFRPSRPICQPSATTGSPARTAPSRRAVIRPSSMRCGRSFTVKAKAPAQSSAAQRNSGRTTPSPSAKAACGRQSPAAMSGRPSTRPVSTRSPTPSSQAEPQTKHQPVEWVNGLARNQRVAAAAASGVGGTGGARSSAASRASAITMPSASRACRVSASRATRSGTSSGQPRRSVTSAGRAPSSAAIRPAT